MTSEDVVPESAWALVETAARLLEADGFIIRPGEYGPWVVGPTHQYQALGYVAFLLAPG